MRKVELNQPQVRRAFPPLKPAAPPFATGAAFFGRVTLSSRLHSAPTCQPLECRPPVTPVAGKKNSEPGNTFTDGAGCAG